ncbi:MAG: PLP-dependent aminotransferase family protein, partial [Eubacteriales bacterium]|nr:PLP-dependent aminotransferase family protein [Eubacteriales bacterium]
MNYEFSDRLKNLQGNAIREIFKLLSQPGVISFAGGFPAKETLPVAEIKDITNRILDENGAEILQYGGTEGYYPLIESSCEYVKRDGIVATPDKTLVISGGQQGIDLTFKAFINKGDRILVENPTYLACLHILKTYEGEAIGVDSDEDGINIVDLAKKLVLYSPKILYLVPNFSNPTGKTLSVEKRQAVYELCKKHGCIILEDNPYGEIRFSGNRVPAIKSFDRDGIVIYITSFSKVISPGLRTGIAVA